MPWVYILHLERPLAHARHYSGCTAELQNRLKAHALGQGSAFTRHLAKIGIEWKLGALFQVKEDLNTIRGVERILKDQHHAPDYCPLCRSRPARLPGATVVPVSAAPFPTDSRGIKEAAASASSIRNRKDSHEQLHDPGLPNLQDQQ